MKIITLKKNPLLYSCNAYLVLGSWNRIEDVNTLVDIGQDGYVITEIESIYTGIGKRPVEKIVFTHNHFDHTAGLKAVKQMFSPMVCAFQQFNGVDVLLKDRDTIKMGDGRFEIIHMPGHSEDSILLYCEKERLIFTGDTSLNIRSRDISCTDEFMTKMERLASLKIESIYPGHDKPLMRGAHEIIEQSYKNLLRAYREKDVGMTSVPESHSGAAP